MSKLINILMKKYKDPEEAVIRDGLTVAEASALGALYIAGRP